MKGKEIWSLCLHKRTWSFSFVYRAQPSTEKERPKEVHSKEGTVGSSSTRREKREVLSFCVMRHSANDAC